MSPSGNVSNVGRAPPTELATPVCLGLLVALASTAFSGTLLAQSPEKPKHNLLFIGPPPSSYRTRFTRSRIFPQKNVRVLLRLDADKLELTRKGVKRTDRDFAVIWARNYGKGRVLYNGLGHVQAVWDRPEFQKMWLEMIQWSMGLLPGDATPRPKPDK